jgi:hypothetical protein
MPQAGLCEAEKVQREKRILSERHLSLSSADPSLDNRCLLLTLGFSGGQGVLQRSVLKTLESARLGDARFGAFDLAEMN